MSNILWKCCSSNSAALTVFYPVLLFAMKNLEHTGNINQQSCREVLNIIKNKELKVSFRTTEVKTLLRLHEWSVRWRRWICEPVKDVALLHPDQISSETTVRLREPWKGRISVQNLCFFVCARAKTKHIYRASVTSVTSVRSVTWGACVSPEDTDTTQPLLLSLRLWDYQFINPWLLFLMLSLHLWNLFRAYSRKGLQPGSAYTRLCIK